MAEQENKVFRIIIEQSPEGTTVNVENAYNRDHSIYMLSSAINVLLLDSAENNDSEETTNDVQELSDNDTNEDEKDVSKLQ